MKDMKRILLKLSGEALAGEKSFGFDEATCLEVGRQVKEITGDEVNNIKWYDVGLKVRRIYDMVISGC